MRAHPHARLPVVRAPRNTRAQVILEYAVWVAVVVAAIIAMQIYMKRGIEGGYRGVADSFGRQYSPGKTQSGWVTTVRGTTGAVSRLRPNQTVTVNGISRTVDIMETTTYIGQILASSGNTVTVVPGNQTTESFGSETVDAPAGTNLWNN